MEEKKSVMAHPQIVPDPEVPEKTVRRKFTAAYVYRVLAKKGELKERRRQVSRHRYAKPEILAKAPNEAWSWDITKLKGSVKWTYFVPQGPRRVRSRRLCYLRRIY